jgi:hypothetical protein
MFGTFTTCPQGAGGVFFGPLHTVLDTVSDMAILEIGLGRSTLTEPSCGARIPLATRKFNDVRLRGVEGRATRRSCLPQRSSR